MRKYWQLTGVVWVLILMVIWGINLKGEEEIDLEKLAADIKEVTEKNFKGMNTEDIEIVMSTIHPKSSVYLKTKASIVQFNTLYDLKHELLSFKFVVLDEEYAIARIKQRTKKIKGPEFKDNEIEVYNIYCQHQDDWKIWHTTILKITYLD